MGTVDDGVDLLPRIQGLQDSRAAYLESVYLCVGVCVGLCVRACVSACVRASFYLVVEHAMAKIG